MINYFAENPCCNYFIPLRIINNLSIFENNKSLHSQISLFFDWGLIENSLFNVSLNELSLIPEFFLAFTAVTIITHCSLIAYNKKYNSVLLQFSVTSLCMLIIFLTLLLYLHEGSITIKHLSFEFSFLNDSLGFLSKIITIIASLFCMYLLQDYIIEYKINSTEYDLLMLYAILGLTMLITANDFGTIFLALELQSLSLYMLSGFKKNSIYSIESGLKYFILGALSAAYFLLGWSLLYGISGLFVLLGFHFFFLNIFSDSSNKVEKNAIEYKPNHNNKSDNSEFIENSLTPWDNNLLMNMTNEFDEIELLSLFNSHSKITLKLAEFLCCDYSNNIENIVSKNEALSVEDEILNLYDSRKPKIKDENQLHAYNEENLKLKTEKKLHENKQIMQQMDSSDKCWFCEILIKTFKKAIHEEDLLVKLNNVRGCEDFLFFRLTNPNRPLPQVPVNSILTHKELTAIFKGAFKLLDFYESLDFKQTGKVDINKQKMFIATKEAIKALFHNGGYRPTKKDFSLLAFQNPELIEKERLMKMLVNFLKYKNLNVDQKDLLTEKYNDALILMIEIFLDNQKDPAVAPKFFEKIPLKKKCVTQCHILSISFDRYL
jgi:hypothetical protein